MKTTAQLLSFLLFFLFIACSKKDAPTPPPTPPPPPPPPIVVTPSFNATVSGQAPKATVTLVNTSTGAENYKWTFSKGAGTDSSLVETPEALTIDKKGDFTITLTAKKGEVTQTVSRTVNIAGSNAILSYSDVKFGIHNLGSLPYLYSVTENKFYQRSEVNATTGPRIDLVFWKDGINSVASFQSPHNKWSYADLTIPGAKTTEVLSEQNATQLSAAQFDGEVTDNTLGALNIVDNNAIFLANPHHLPVMILFKLADGRKGAIKLKEHGRDHLLADIKAQKY